MTARLSRCGTETAGNARHRQTGAGGVPPPGHRWAPAGARVIVNGRLHLAVGGDANRVGAEPDDELKEHQNSWLEPEDFKGT